MQEIEFVNLKAVQSVVVMKKTSQINGSKKQIKLFNNLEEESIFGIIKDNYLIIYHLLINLLTRYGMLKTNRMIKENISISIKIFNHLPIIMVQPSGKWFMKIIVSKQEDKTNLIIKKDLLVKFVEQTNEFVRLIIYNRSFFKKWMRGR